MMDENSKLRASDAITRLAKIIDASDIQPRPVHRPTGYFSWNEGGIPNLAIVPRDGKIFYYCCSGINERLGFWV